MARLKNLVYVKTEEDFNNLLADGTIEDSSIVFCKEASQVYTHGTWFPDIDRTFTIVPSIDNAIVMINGVERTSTTVWVGETVEWSVSCDGYITQNGTYTVNDDTTLTVEMVEEDGALTFIYHGYSGTPGIYKGSSSNSNTILFCVNGDFDLKVNGVSVENAGSSSTTTFTSYLNSGDNIVKIYPASGAKVYRWRAAYSVYSSLQYITEVLSWGDCEYGACDYMFACAASLRKLPKLTEGFSDITSFASFCYEAGSLTDIPTDFFDNCRKVTSFSSAFNQCDLQGESPYTEINGVKVHLYERENYPDEFSEPTTHSSCFKSCTGLLDYNSIPDGWK